MSYHLGVDLGTTYTATAVQRDGQVEIVDLGTRAPVVPSVVLRRHDGALLTGEAAERRATTEPLGVAREFKRRMGDPTPIIVGGAPYSADALMARLLRSVVDAVAEREGGPAASITVSHPANWGPFKLDLLQQTIRLAGLGDVDVGTVPEPEAAAIHYASQERVEPGAVVAVYDLGGGTFDAAVLRRTPGGWDVLGTPEGVEHLGGIDFDEAVFHHVRTAIGEAFDQLDPDDPATITAVARLRQECVAAKEALSSDVDVVIPVLLPNVQMGVRLVRTELEAMIRPRLVDSVDVLRRALSSAGVEPREVDAVLLVGGSSRVPLVAQLVGSELHGPVAVDAHPKHAVAMGAAIVAADRDRHRQVSPIGASLPHQANGQAPRGTALAPPRPRAAAGVAPGRSPVRTPESAGSLGIGDDPTVVRPLAVGPPARLPVASDADSGGLRRILLPGVVVLALVAVLGTLAIVQVTANEEPDDSLAVSSRSASSSVPSSVQPSVPPSVSSSVPPSSAPPSSVPPSSSVPPPPVPSPVSSTVSVAATQEGWTNTEIDIEAGDEVRITATGEVFDDVNGHPNRTFPPDGEPDVRREHTGDPFPDLNHAALLGRIGDDGEIFVVGAETQVTADRPGQLQLTINDDRFDDNRGTFEVEITITRAGAP